MPELWLPIGLAALIAGSFLVWRLALRRTNSAMPVPDTREHRLSQQLARVLNCRVRDVLASVRYELNHSPQAADETILKRARYHYQQNLPERTCNVWQDRKAG